MRLPVLTALALALSSAGCDAPVKEDNESAAAAQALSVSDAAVQLPAVPGRPGAAYFALRAGADPVRLTSVSSDRVERIELHETKMEGSIMRMVPLGQAEIQPGATLAFQQGGRHAMLFGVDPTLKAGDTVTLTFTFEGGQKLDTQAEVRAFGSGHGGH